MSSETKNRLVNLITAILFLSVLLLPIGILFAIDKANDSYFSEGYYAGYQVGKQHGLSIMETAPTEAFTSPYEADPDASPQDNLDRGFTYGYMHGYRDGSSAEQEHYYDTIASIADEVNEELDNYKNGDNTITDTLSNIESYLQLIYDRYSYEE